jgi:hypothetical protein
MTGEVGGMLIQEELPSIFQLWSLSCWSVSELWREIGYRQKGCRDVCDQYYGGSLQLQIRGDDEGIQSVKFGFSFSASANREFQVTRIRNLPKVA